MLYSESVDSLYDLADFVAEQFFPLKDRNDNGPEAAQGSCLPGMHKALSSIPGIQRAEVKDVGPWKALWENPSQFIE